MNAITITARSTDRRSSVRRTVRWMATFTGFPLGGLAAFLIIGPVHSLGTAVLGGLITGGILGAVQAWGLGRVGPAARAWIAATAAGLAIGLGVGSAAVGYDTSLTALAVQGAICGLVVGAAQAVVLRPRVGALAMIWPPFLAAAWAAGWTITALGGIQVQEQFTVFGSYGATTVAALTSVLPAVLSRTTASNSRPTGTEKSPS